MHWIERMIMNRMITYSGLYSNPVEILNHFLFCIGNGIDFPNGNPVECDIDLKKHFTSNATIDDMIKEHFLSEDYMEHLEFTQGLHKTFWKFKHIGEDYSQEKGELHKIWGEVDKVRNLKVIKMDLLTSEDYWRKLLKESKIESHTSTGKYCCITKLTPNTDKDFIKVVLSFSKALMGFANDKQKVFIQKEINRLETY